MSIASDSGPGPFKPGDTPQFTVKVTNNGPSDAPGVAVHVDLPSTMRYETSSITGFGNARTQPLDARAGSSSPEWGFWDLATPATGSTTCTDKATTPSSCLLVTFEASITSTPGDYTISARATGDNTSGDVSAPELKFGVIGAAKLDISARVQAGVLGYLSSATYAVTITNTGTSAAQNVALLVTLPPMLRFEKSVTPFQGNASRASPVDPVKHAILVFYSGWTIPAASSAGPGFVTVVFIASVSKNPPAGSFTINAHVTDDGGDSITLTNAAPVTVQGSASTPSAAVAPTSGAG